MEKTLRTFVHKETEEALKQCSENSIFALYNNLDVFSLFIPFSINLLPHYFTNLLPRPTLKEVETFHPYYYRISLLVKEYFPSKFRQGLRPQCPITYPNLYRVVLASKVNDSRYFVVDLPFSSASQNKQIPFTLERLSDLFQGVEGISSFCTRKQLRLNTRVILSSDRNVLQDFVQYRNLGLGLLPEDGKLFTMMMAILPKLKRHSQGKNLSCFTKMNLVFFFLLFHTNHPHLEYYLLYLITWDASITKDPETLEPLMFPTPLELFGPTRPKDCFPIREIASLWMLGAAPHQIACPETVFVPNRPDLRHPSPPPKRHPPLTSFPVTSNCVEVCPIEPVYSLGARLYQSLTDREEEQRKSTLIQKGTQFTYLCPPSLTVPETKPLSNEPIFLPIPQLRHFFCHPLRRINHFPNSFQFISSETATTVTTEIRGVVTTLPGPQYNDGCQFFEFQGDDPISLQEWESLEFEKTPEPLTSTDYPKRPPKYRENLRKIRERQRLDRLNTH